MTHLSVSTSPNSSISVASYSHLLMLLLSSCQSPKSLPTSLFCPSPAWLTLLKPCPTLTTCPTFIKPCLTLTIPCPTLMIMPCPTVKGTCPTLLLLLNLFHLLIKLLNHLAPLPPSPFLINLL